MWRIRSRLMPVVLLLSMSASSAGCKEKEQPPPQWTKPAGSTSLPNVLIIGDSISEGYYPYLQSNLRSVAAPHRPAGNHSATWEGLKYLDQWLEGPQWDVIHFNFGLHDVLRSTLEQYEANLTTIVSRLQKTGAKLVFATSTPVLAGTSRFTAGSSVAYNDVARRVMERAGGISIDDLHHLAEMHTEYQRPRDLHFTEQGYRALGRQVADSILRALGNRIPSPDEP